LDRIAPVDGDVSMEDLLQDFGVRDEALILGDEPFEDLLRISLVGVRRPDEIHRNVRVEEDHSGGVSR
jgi:hypothetical protein